MKPALTVCSLFSYLEVKKCSIFRPLCVHQTNRHEEVLQRTLAMASTHFKAGSILWLYVNSFSTDSSGDVGDGSFILHRTICFVFQEVSVVLERLS